MEVADNLFEDMSSGSNKSWDDDSEDEHPNTGQPGGGHDMGSSDSLSGMREIQENSRSTRDGCWYGRGSVSPASFLVGMSPGLSPGVPGQAGSSEDEFQAKQRAADWGLSPQAAPSMSPGGMGALGVSAELVKEEQPEQQQQQRAFGQTHAEGMQDSTAQGAGSSSQVCSISEHSPAHCSHLAKFALVTNAVRIFSRAGAVLPPHPPPSSSSSTSLICGILHPYPDLLRTTHAGPAVRRGGLDVHVHDRGAERAD
eukprot:1032642-Rhodomonas_salina.2